MAAGCNYLNYERLHDICCVSSGLHDFLHHEKLLLDFHGPCSCCSDGFVNFTRISRLLTVTCGVAQSKNAITNVLSIETAFSPACI